MTNVRYDEPEEDSQPGAPVLDSPFDSIESAQEYIGLLRGALKDARRAIHEDIDAIALVTVEQRERRLQALQLVSYKLEQLGDHLSASNRILKNLRTLRRILLSASEDVRSA